MTPSFHENETTLFRLKKSMYPLKENHPPQHERIKIKTEYMKKNGLFILTTTDSPPCMKKLIGMVWGILFFMRFQIFYYSLTYFILIIQPQ
ncbi:Hypothetical protein SCC1_0749 [Pectobacterium versatile]|nr:Hypothetical protein SCC1_0749 [Pectobacterium versatile]